MYIPWRCLSFYCHFEGKKITSHLDICFKKLLRWIMYSGTQRMIELASFTIARLRLCTIEKVIYKTKLDEYNYFVGLDNPYRLTYESSKLWFVENIMFQKIVCQFLSKN